MSPRKARRLALQGLVGREFAYRAILTKEETLPDGVIDPHHAPRTKGISGFVFELPEIGMPYQVFGDPLDKGKDIRQWLTTPVAEVIEDSNENCRPGCRLFRFKTKNSQYKLLTLPFDDREDEADANCYTLPNGDCIGGLAMGNDACMHDPPGGWANS